MTGRQRPRLTAVLAHPDDESRIMGGTLALCAVRGWHVSLYCATRGEHADDQRPPEEMAHIREPELEAACQALGIAQFHLGRLPDGGLADADADAVTADIVRHLRTVRPHVVVTFGADGRTGHPDHIAVGGFTEAAFQRSADATYRPEDAALGLQPWQAERLYHTALPRAAAESRGWPHPGFPDAELVTVDVTAVMDRKRRAVVDAHASQWAIHPWDVSAGWGHHAVEHFWLAASVPAGATADTDLRAALA